MLHRRGFMTGLVSALAAPAIVHAGNLMPVKQILLRPFTLDDFNKILGPMINQLAEQVAKDILNYGTSPLGFRLQASNFTETVGESASFVKYQPLNIKPMWAKDFCK